MAAATTTHHNLSLLIPQFEGLRIELPELPEKAAKSLYAHVCIEADPNTDTDSKKAQRENASRIIATYGITLKEARGYHKRASAEMRAILDAAAVDAKRATSPVAKREQGSARAAWPAPAEITRIPLSDDAKSVLMKAARRCNDSDIAKVENFPKCHVISQADFDECIRVANEPAKSMLEAAKAREYPSSAPKSD